MEWPSSNCDIQEKCVSAGREESGAILQDHWLASVHLEFLSDLISNLMHLWWTLHQAQAMQTNCWTHNCTCNWGRQDPLLLTGLAVLIYSLALFIHCYSYSWNMGHFIITAFYFKPGSAHVCLLSIIITACIRLYWTHPDRLNYRCEVLMGQHIVG